MSHPTSNDRSAAEGPRERLLDAALEHFLAHGIGDTSLRGLAAALGTSHRMLIYHFESREQLLLEVARRCEAQQRDELRELALIEHDGLLEISRAFWRRITDPQLAPLERLFFEIYGQALQGRPWAAPLLPEAIDTWLPMLTELFSERGSIPPAQARARARLALAVARGLLLDLLATGARAQVQSAYEEFEALLFGR
jgi:AcrR family transcriptional regulator